MNIILYPIVESIFTYDQHAGKRKSCILFSNNNNNNNEDEGYMIEISHKRKITDSEFTSLMQKLQTIYPLTRI